MINMQWVDSFDEEISQFSDLQASTSHLGNFVSFPIQSIINFFFDNKYIFSFRYKYVSHIILMAMCICSHKKLSIGPFDTKVYSCVTRSP